MIEYHTTPVYPGEVLKDELEEIDLYRIADRGITSSFFFFHCFLIPCCTKFR